MPADDAEIFLEAPSEKLNELCGNVIRVGDSNIPSFNDSNATVIKSTSLYNCIHYL